MSAIESVLSDLERMRQLDSMDMFGALYGLPEQCVEAWRLGNEAMLPLGTFKNVVVTGLGGSAIGGDLLRVYAADRSGLPVMVNRHYVMPRFTGPETLVIAVSYSGNTEETLSAYAEARAKGATLMALTTGGKLKEVATNDGVPVITIPGGISPRAATGYLFLPMVAVMYRLGLLDDPNHDFNELIPVLQEWRDKLKPESPGAENPAKQLALEFHDHLPIIWGASGTSEVVAQRWKGQINENAKAPAYYNVLPELNHNEVVGLEVPRSLLKHLHVVFLRDHGDHPRVTIRMNVTRSIAGGAVGGVSEIKASGKGLLARMYSLIYIGDYASVYLAALYGVDPGPVKIIDYLKAELAKQ